MSTTSWVSVSLPVKELPRLHRFQVQPLTSETSHLLTAQIPLTQRFKERPLASNTPGLAHAFCPVLSTQMSSTVSRGSFQADTGQEKFSAECTSEERYSKALSLPVLAPVPIQVLPASTCRVRTRPGPTGESHSHFCISLRSESVPSCSRVALNLRHYHSVKSIFKVFLFLPCKYFGATRCLSSG